MDLIDRAAAIDALKQKWDGMVTSVFDVIKNLQPTCDQLATDCISRQTAIELCDWYEHEYSEVDSYFQMFNEELRKLPSAKPEDKCSECDAWNKYKNYSQPDSIWLPLTESDIDHLFDYYAKEKDENLTDRAQELKEAMWVGYMAAKKEQPERKKGKWIEIGEETGAFNIRYVIRKCSECGWSHSLVIPKNYCPNCGSYNGGEQDEP